MTQQAPTGVIATSEDAQLDSLLAQCQAPSVELPDAEAAAWLQRVREEARRELAQLRLPGTKDEEWRFTDISPLREREFRAAPTVALEPQAAAAWTLPEAPATRLTFVNGHYAPQLSDVSGLPADVFAGNLSHLSPQAGAQLSQYLGQPDGGQDAFARLNTAGLQDAAVVWLPRNALVEAPIHLLFLSVPRQEAVLAQPRALVVAQTGACAQLVEQYATVLADDQDCAPYFNNAVTELWLADGAQLGHVRLQEDARSSFHVGRTAAVQARDSRYSCHAVTLGAQLSRHNLQVDALGEQTTTHLNGLTVANGKQLADTHSTLAYTRPYGSSDQLHKCIATDRAKTVFNGKVHVLQAAQLTNAAQLNRNLLLSPKAHAHTKPELQIVADNVQCSHGATVSQLEADELFYLRSRGLNETQARDLLVNAFAAELLERLPIASLRQRLATTVAERVAN